MLYEMSTLSPSSRRERGYTVFEILVVLLIASLVAAFAIPNLFRTAVRTRGMSEVRTLQNGIMQARVRAIQSGWPTVFRFNVSATGVDRIDAWIDTTPNQSWDTGEPPVLEHSLDEGYSLSPDTDFVALGTHRGIVFLPDGTVELASGAVGSATVQLSDNIGNTVRLVVRAPTGMAQAQMLIPGTGDWDDQLKHWRWMS